MEGMVKMINRLINMEVEPISTIIEPIETKNTNYTIEDYAKSFINGMGETQKSRFKKMLENGINCGMSVANSYGVDYDKFIEEVKKQMEV